MGAAKISPVAGLILSYRFIMVFNCPWISRIALVAAAVFTFSATTSASAGTTLATAIVAQSPPPPAPANAPTGEPKRNQPASAAIDTSKPRVDDSWHPADVKELAKLVDSPKLKVKKWPGLELYCDDIKQFKLLSTALGKAWPAATELLGGSRIREGMALRVVALKEPDSIKAYWKILQNGAQAYGNTAPPEVLLTGSLSAGSTRWNLPPTVMLRPGTLASSMAPTRAVHDVGVVVAGWASSYSGFGGPEFLTEGFAGMLQRRSIKNPAAIVSHEQAALKETIHGYGVFASIGAAMNDSSNSPNNWPRMIHNAVKTMIKKGVKEDDERIDALLLRTHEKFARADYGYAWATMEFLFDDNGRSKEDNEPGSRRQRLHRVLEQLKDPKKSAMGQQVRSLKFREMLLEEYNLSPVNLHQDFLTWASKHLPKK